MSKVYECRILGKNLYSVAVLSKPRFVNYPCMSATQVYYNWRSFANFSKREEFRSIPVHHSILKHIESLDIGIPKRTSRKQRTRRKDSKFLHEDDEDRFLENFRTKKRVTTRGQTSEVGAPPLPFASGKRLSQITDDIERGWMVKTKPVKIIARVKSLHDDSEDFPTNDGKVLVPEVALAGRSNVGKSTLLNALLYDDILPSMKGRRKQAPKAQKGTKASTSPRPGETKEITFYQLASKIKDKSTEQYAQFTLWLVDLPGYGFAYDKKAPDWKETLKYYLLNRGKPLKRILLLLDARHGMKKADLDFLESLESDVYSNSVLGKKPNLPPIQLVLTKCDLVSRSDLARRIVQVEKQLSGCLRRQPSKLPVLLVSTKPEQRGVLDLQRELAAVIPAPRFED